MSDRSDDGGPLPETSAHDSGEPEITGAEADAPPGADPRPARAAGSGATDAPDSNAATAFEAGTVPATGLDAAPTAPGDTAADALVPGETAPAIEPDTTALAAPAPGERSSATAAEPTAVIERPREGAAVAPPRLPGADRTALLEHPNGHPFLDARHLTATGRQGTIFADVTLTARPGQVVAVTGDGGDGRTSLLLALTGRFRPDSGTLRVDGRTRPGHIRRRFTIAQAGPPIRFAEYHTVAACIKETTAVSGGAATAANIHAWLDRLAVGVDTGDTYGFLPRIDQIRFAIACAAASRTPAIAVDDADTGLDTAGAERVFEALRTVADAGQLVLAACTLTAPPADTVVDLRVHHRDPHPDHRPAENGGLR
ncbi:ATP-binding cassette domain-containing protein [Glycomyces terrestris]|uniref:ATP-binding cassette domain-containing protein n=1 Tax=Glycomyces terrestris TaxID=2493553 RepID=A0A426USN3_9ACTN|nr:ABC transporter ATP-binding protein [Glycomyces terrestris]RRR96142.1 ATP-binding cassette domain-containing protein [Glycomyces terrestris]